MHKPPRESKAAISWETFKSSGILARFIGVPITCLAARTLPSQGHKILKIRIPKMSLHLCRISIVKPYSSFVALCAIGCSWLGSLPHHWLAYNDDNASFVQSYPSWLFLSDSIKRGWYQTSWDNSTFITQFHGQIHVSRWWSMCCHE